jgi:hypothetical protein
LIDDGVASAVIVRSLFSVMQSFNTTGGPPVVGVIEMSIRPSATLGIVNVTEVSLEEVTDADVPFTVTVGVPVAPNPEPVTVTEFEPV